jgi:hypothetical protein
VAGLAPNANATLVPNVAVAIAETKEAVVTVIADIKLIGNAGAAIVTVVKFVSDVVVVVHKAR